MFIEHFVIFETFFGITAHTGDAIKNDSVFLFNYINELIPIGAILFSSGVELSNDGGSRIDCGDVGNLACNLLMLGADATISIKHNKNHPYISIRFDYRYLLHYYNNAFSIIRTPFP